MFASTPLGVLSRALLGSLALCAPGGCASGGVPRGQSPSVPELARLPTGATLIGLGGGDLKGIMGQPALIREEGAAQYWRYGLASCQLDLFLYADPETASARVAYLDVRPALGAPPASTEHCADIAGRLRAGSGSATTQPVPGPPISAQL